MDSVEAPIAAWRAGEAHLVEQRFWEAHEAFEAVWLGLEGADAGRVRAVIQVAAALHKPAQAREWLALGRVDRADAMADAARRILERAERNWSPSGIAALDAWYPAAAAAAAETAAGRPTRCPVLHVPSEALGAWFRSRWRAARPSR